jgi:hypothetical protein
MYECSQRLEFQALLDTRLALLMIISSLSIPPLRCFRSDLSLLELATEVSSLKRDCVFNQWESKGSNLVICNVLSRNQP